MQGNTEVTISEDLSFTVSRPLGFQDDLVDFVFVDAYSSSQGFGSDDCHVAGFQGAQPQIRINDVLASGLVVLLRCPEVDVAATDAKISILLPSDISLELDDVVSLSAGTYTTSSEPVGGLPLPATPDREVETAFLALENDRVSENLSLGGDGVAPIFVSIESLAAQPHVLEVEFSGVLESSSDLEGWTVLDPQPTSPFQITTEDPARFFRVR
ncbi:MAG: hypothetical protein ACSHYB_09975 [Roseibacillus sp.]